MNMQIFSFRSVGYSVGRSVGTGLRVFGLAALMPAFVAGCMSDRVLSYTDVQSSRQAEVTWVDLPHEVMFDVGEHHLSALEKERLDTFLGSMDVAATDSVVIDPGSTRGGIVEPRIEALSDYIGRHVPESSISISHLGWAETDERMRIIVGRYVVTPPNCPNFQAPSHRNSNNLESSNHGCATATNLALMVADPGDLIRGRKLSRPDGPAYTDAFARYRAGLVREVIFTNNLSESE